ncbi:MAG TPA: M3 family oligoendopeptidase [Spirochaetia bacterium]|nr:M3 family oligoendopeptidase [Spirochaetia bacterium]
MPTGSETPRWNLDSVYAGYDSEEYRADRDELVKTSSSLLKKLDDDSSRKRDTEKWLKSIIKKMNAAYGLYGTLEAYIYCNHSVDTKDSKTLAELSSLEEDVLPLREAEVRFRRAMKSLQKKLPQLAKKSKTIARFRFYLDEQIELANRQMSVEEENLAADLMRPGADAWGRLQGTISSNLSWPWDGDERKTVVELRSLAMDPSRDIREKAFRKELEAWKSMETPIAAALNGVKGFTVILDKRRNYATPLDHAAFQARISRETLDAQISTMESNLGVFRSYLKSKAKLLGVKKCAFYDLFAPAGEATRTWSFQEARDFIVEQFSSFSWELGDFAERAFREKWIDAEPREGKVGGAFCAPMPKAGESRILANFDGSFDGLFTLAHELGHGYHGWVLKDLPYVQQDYPMTLAETASIFCETIVFNRAMEASSADDRLAVLELFLQSATQVIVDILSRYKFEAAVFERREKGDLSSEELCELMLQAQRDTYGDGLDEKLLHPYMWAVKSHYYSAGLSFYNFPYAFGQLFGLGLYATYTRDVHEFPTRYKELLQTTGQTTANEVTKSAGFDIEDGAFWQSGIDVIAERANEFAALVKEQSAE